MQDWKPVSTPIHSNYISKAAESPEQCTNAMAYQQIIESSMYLVIVTRSDLAYMITHLSQFDESLSIMHLTAAD